MEKCKATGSRAKLVTSDVLWASNAEIENNGKPAT